MPAENITQFDITNIDSPPKTDIVHEQANVDRMDPFGAPALK
jgi:hypothetical protein